MRTSFETGILTTAGIVLLMTLSSGASAVTDRETAAVEAAIPIPEAAEVPPLTIDDLDVPTAKPQTAPAVIESPPPKSDDTPAKAETTPPVEAVDLKSLTGPDLVKAPIAPGLNENDAALARALRELLATKLGSTFDRKNERSAVEAFYRDRGFAPLWLSNKAPSDRGRAATAFLRGVAADGLDPLDYPIPNFSGDAAVLAKAELQLTRSVFTFARHASTGRVAFTRVSGAILFHPKAPEPEQILAKLAGAEDVGAALDSYNPQQPGYKALKAKLAEKRGKPAVKEEIVRVSAGPILRPGAESDRVIALRKRLKVGNQEDPRYDDEVTEAVKAFQAASGLRPDGVLGPRTLATLNGRSPSQVDVVETIIANMERWRWLPRDLGKAYVVVNIPDYSLAVSNNGKTVWSTRIVVGKPGDHATPLLSETIKFITVNPTWNVPPSIIRNEYLPVFEQSPQALADAGIKVAQNNDGTIRMYQPPGPRNALGRLRFNFPNKFLVYQHDTPDKHLFARSERAYSHGCMRVQNPEKYAEVLLSISQPSAGYTLERIRRMYGDSERNIALERHIPVYLTYQTAFVDEAGVLQIRRDIYGHDARILRLLHGPERRVADIPISRDYNSSSRPVYAELPVERDTFFGSFFGPRESRYGPRYEPAPRDGRYSRRGRDRRYYDDEPNFFEQLFR